MPTLETEVLVVGGGSTGAGVARDAALRGFSTVLVERGDLAAGTTGRFHGLLHSGGRYAVKDPVAARECVVEKDVFASEFVIRAWREGLMVMEIPIQLHEKRQPSIHLFRRVPNVLKNVGKLVYVIRIRGT